MADNPPFESPSLRQHRKQRSWQILFPFILFSILILVGAGFAAFAGGAVQARLWSDIAIIWMAAPLLFFALLLLALLIGLIYLLARLTRATPPVTAKVQRFGRRVSSGVRSLADKATQPVLWLQQFGATLSALFRVKGE